MPDGQVCSEGVCGLTVEMRQFSSVFRSLQLKRLARLTLRAAISSPPGTINDRRSYIYVPVFPGTLCV